MTQQWPVSVVVTERLCCSPCACGQCASTLESVQPHLARCRLLQQAPAACPPRQIDFVQTSHVVRWLAKACCYCCCSCCSCSFLGNAKAGSCISVPFVHQQSLHLSSLTVVANHSSSGQDLAISSAKGLQTAAAPSGTPKQPPLCCAPADSTSAVHKFYLPLVSMGTAMFVDVATGNSSS